METHTENSTTVKSRTNSASSATAPKVAIFGLPKSFVDPDIDLIQRNALSSWSRLGPDVEAIVLGNETGIEETAIELGLKYSAQIRMNDHGTPLLSDAFRQAQSMTDAEVLIYCNCDVILFGNLIDAIKQIQADSQVDSFVAFGRRIDLRVQEAINFDHPSAQDELQAKAHRMGRKAPVVCKEFFAFTRDMYQSIPDFAVGRGNWDNWMIAHAKSVGVPVIDVSGRVQVIHQDHSYLHIKQSRFKCYVSGDEAKENQRLAGGKNIIGGSTGTWTLEKDGPKRNRIAWLNSSFWLDFHRFARMVARLPFQR